MSVNRDCGIYAIINRITDRTYIGSSTRMKKRWIDHKSALNRKVHHCEALQAAWNKDEESSFYHMVVELCSSELLEARESDWMGDFDDIYNTSNVTHNPMRNPESVAKMLATRGDKQKGVKSSSAKLTEEKYLQIVYALATTTYSAEDISDYFGLSPRSIRDIQSGNKHHWIKEQFPEQFQAMFQWRKNLRTFRAMGATTPQIDLPIETDFVKKLGSFRRDYHWTTEQERKLEEVQKEKTKIERANKKRAKEDDKIARKQGREDARIAKEDARIAKEDARIAKKEAKELARLAKEEQKLQRKLKKQKAKTPWIELVHSTGKEIIYYSIEECEDAGLEMKYLTQLKSGKLLRYKGYRLKK